MTGIPAIGAESRSGLSYIQGIESIGLWTETVGEVLSRVSSEYPDNIGLAWLTTTGLDTMTWAEIYVRARAAAADLSVLNPGKARVVLAGPNSADWVVAMFGCALAGMAVVPMSPLASDDEVLHVLRQTSPGVVVAPETISEQPVRGRLSRLAATHTPQVRVRHMSGWTEVATPPDYRSGAQPEDEFLLQLTSGTTGRPKAASLSHLAVINCARAFADGSGARIGDAWLNPLPVYHVGGFVSGVLSCLTIAGTYVVVERFSPQTMLRAIREARPTLLGLVPTMLLDMLADPEITDADFDSVRTVLGGATNVDPRLIDEVERRLGIRFLVAYGQSESPCMAMTLATDSAEVRTRTIGQPLPGRDFYIADPAGNVVSTDTVGELCVRGPLNMLGYVDADGSLDTATTDAGWRRTGDMCSMDSAGVLTFRGRMRDVIIRGGTNIYPAEVEHSLSAHESIAEIAVFGVPDERLGERVVAAVIPTTPNIDTADLAAFAAAKLGAQKRPAEWIIVDDFPRTSAGKVRKHILREGYCDRS